MEGINDANEWARAGGNYWSDYDGTDIYSGLYQNETGSDGIEDTLYDIYGNNQDNYPLMGMFSSFDTSLGKHVNVISNSTIEDFDYFQYNSTIKMYIANMTANQTSGFCRICIPKALMNDTFTVFVNHTQVDYDLLPCSNNTHNYLYFTYNHSTQEVILIPEFLSLLILPLFMIATLLTVIVYRRKLLDTQNLVKF